MQRVLVRWLSFGYDCTPQDQGKRVMSLRSSVHSLQLVIDNGTQKCVCLRIMQVKFKSALARVAHNKVT